jgi:cytochrome P450
MEVAVDYSPYDDQIHLDPYPVYAQLRATAPVYRNEDVDFWALSRHADVAAALRDSAGFSNANGPLLDSSIWGPDAHKIMSFTAMDPPQHTQLRAVVSQAFSPRRIAELEPQIRRIVGTHLEAAMERTSFDFVTDLAAKIPMDVISELIGIPAGDRAEARRLINLAFHRPPGARDITPEGAQALGTLVEYHVGLIDQRRRRPGTDLLSTLAEASIDGSPLTDQQITALLGLLITAGYETTLRLLGNAWYWAWQYPEQRVRAFDGRIGAWVEETLRYDTPVQYLVRTLTRGRTLHGVQLPQGARILLLIGAANRDPEVFPNPDRYDLDRDTRQVISFGGGPHYCLGGPLARLEAEIVLDELVARVSEYEIDSAHLRRVHTTNIRGFDCLPTTVKPN